MRRICLFVVLMIGSVCGYEVYRCNSLEQTIQHIDADTLVVTDINYTLLKHGDQLGSDAWARAGIADIMASDQVDKATATERFCPAWHRALRSSFVIPSEPNTPRVIQKLQGQGVTVLGLTNNYTEMAYTLVDGLARNHIDLKREALYPYDLEIEGGYAAKYIDGVIFVGLKNDKGKTLFRFLDQIGHQPRAIVYLDDKLRHVQSVARVAVDRNIPFIGIHYTGCHKERDTY